MQHGVSAEVSGSEWPALSETPAGPRVCSTGPFLALGLTEASPERTALAAEIASMGSDLPTLRRF